MLWHWGLTAESGLHAGLGEFSILEEVFFVRLVLESVHNTIVTCKLKLPSSVMHYVNDLLVHQGEAVGRLAQLSATRTPVRIPESRLSNLCVDLRLGTPLYCQSVVVANACPARLFHIVRSQWHGGAWRWSSTSTFFMSDGTVWVWLGIMYRLAWRQRAERAHEQHVVLSMNDFDEPEISQTRPSKILPQASHVAACLRPEHTTPGAKKQANCFRFPPLTGRRCLKLKKDCLSCFSSSWNFMFPLLSLLLSGTWQASAQYLKSSAMHAWLPRARPKLRSTICEPKIDQRASTNVRSYKKFVRENLKRIVFEYSNIRCSSTP